MKRRRFIQSGALLGASLALKASPLYIPGMRLNEQKIKVAFIGVGARGSGQLDVILKRSDVLITAIADIDTDACAKAVQQVTKAGQPKPKVFSNGSKDYKNLLNQKDVDAVIICTPWTYHVPMAIDAMKAGKAVGCEVSGATSIQECWDLVHAQEETGSPFMILENVCYRRDVMAVLNMVRKDMLGEMIHLEGGYEHDLREVKFNDGKRYYGGGVEFGEKGYSEARWRTMHSVGRNGDLYPTHGLGPIHTAININRGNRYTHLTSMSSKARGLHNYIVNHPAGGADHPNAKVNFELGDVVTTMIRTVNDETITLTHDTNLPRPYSLGFRFQGTKGIWMDLNKSIYIEGKGKAHTWESTDQYFKDYDHPLWAKYGNDAAGAGHGGMDFFVLHAFIEALKASQPMPLDVYDCATWKAVTVLSEESIAEGSAPKAFPDFTNGNWITRKPIFALDGTY